MRITCHIPLFLKNYTCRTCSATFAVVAPPSQLSLSTATSSYLPLLALTMVQYWEVLNLDKRETYGPRGKLAEWFCDGSIFQRWDVEILVKEQDDYDPDIESLLEEKDDYQCKARQRKDSRSIRDA